MAERIKELEDQLERGEPPVEEDDEEKSESSDGNQGEAEEEKKVEEEPEPVVEEPPVVVEEEAKVEEQAVEQQEEEETKERANDLEGQVQFSKETETDDFLDFDYSQCAAVFKGKESDYDMYYIKKLSETEIKYIDLRTELEAIDRKFVINVVQNPLI